VVELLGSIPPGEDGQELTVQEAVVIAARELQGSTDTMRPSFAAEGAEGVLLPRQMSDAAPEPLPPNTTVLTKTTVETELDGDEVLEQNEVRVVRAGRGDTLIRILTRLGADTYQARLMVEAAKGIFADNQIQPGHEVRVTLVPTLQRADRMEPAAFSVFTASHDHKISVTRNAAGEFVGSATPVDTRIVRAAMSDSDQPQASSLYAAVYNAALIQGLPTDSILKVLRIHAYETDFRRRVRPSDTAEFFFETADDNPSGEPAPGELLYTSLSTGGESQRYWRYRTPDGVVDYYDEFGNNSRKFLMRRPIRGENVHFTSGYGIRYHPLLNERRLHTGVDWAAPIGTPILAAGNGVVEEADRKGQYGNYVRIRHANGYQTAYAHMSRFGPGIRQGVKVRQGQVIGFVGNTGLSSGPHLHYEVLVNNRYVDPMQIQVPRERRLTGKVAAAFQRERQRIEELMRRAPVMTVTK
jgi:murein DD-endopeptidase MepM/ murein hydrolase activator NlpD